MTTTQARRTLTTLILVVLAYLLAACDTTPTAPVSAEFAGLQAAATSTAVSARLTATAASANATVAVAVAQATQQAAQAATATRTAQDAIATQQMVYANVSAAATGTAVAIITEREHAASTATAVSLITTQQQKQAKAASVAEFWMWLRYLFLLGVLFLIPAFGWAIVSAAQAHLMRHQAIEDGNGYIVAVPRGYQLPPRTIINQPAPAPPAPPAPPIIRIPYNSGNATTHIPNRRQDVALRGYTFSGALLDKLERTGLNRERLGMSGGEYSRMTQILQQAGYAEDKDGSVGWQLTEAGQRWVKEAGL
jgi:hypothetical protein